MSAEYRVPETTEQGFAPLLYAQPNEHVRSLLLFGPSSHEVNE